MKRLPRKLLRRRPDGIHLVQFFRQMTVLTRAGMAMIRSLEICGRQCADATLAAAVHRVLSEMRGGARLSQALRIAGAPFTSLHVNATQSAELSGNYAQVFEELGHWEEKQNNLRRRVAGALNYPMLICALSAVGTVLLVKFLLPLILSVQRQNETGGNPAPLPLPTRVLLVIGGVLDDPLQLLAGSVLVGMLAILLRWFAARPRVRLGLDGLSLRLPVVGGLIRKTITIRVCLAMSSLLRAGLPLVQAVEQTGQSSGSVYARERVFSAAASHIRKGEKFSQSVEGVGLFPPSFHGMVAVGERTGQLDGMLARLATLYEMELEADIETCFRALEPIIIASVGVVVLGVLLCAFLPLYDLLRSFGQ